MHYAHLNPARTTYAALRYGMLLLLLLLAPAVVAILASAAEAETPQIACPSLLLDNECRAYQAEMSSATTTDTRDALKARYADLLAEREHACSCNLGRSWIQLTSTDSDALRTLFSAP